MNREIIKLVRRFVTGSLILFAITGICIVSLAVFKALDSKRLVDSQIDYNNALKGQIGSPQEIIHRYEK